MATFTNQATLTYNGGTASSNITTGELLEVLTATKTAVVPTYRSGRPITYLITLVNAGTADLTGLTVADDLGGYTFNGATVYPLAYSRKFNGLFVETLGYPEMGDLTVMDSDEITAGLLAAFGKRSDLKKRIEQIDRQIVGPEKERMIGKLSEYILRNEF